jgi:DNA (cytosine-5)-methyltransferase 1
MCEFYLLSGGRNSVQRQVGNAVPSLMSEILAREISTQLLGRPVSGPLKLSIAHQGETPPPEPVAQVPEKYLDQLGDHPDHPGTGKGRMYASKASG